RDPRAHPPDRVEDHVETPAPVPIPGPPRLPGLTRSSQATRAAHRTPGRSHLLSSGPAPLLSLAAPTPTTDPSVPLTVRERGGLGLRGGFWVPGCTKSSPKPKTSPILVV